MRKILGAFLAAALTFGSLSGMAYAKLNVEVDEHLPKAGSVNVTAEHMTEEQPLAAGTADSSLFRIPAIITLENGDLLAAADARWTTSADWGGLDTIASVSSDNGKTWYYSFPIYFPDSNTTYPGMEVATTAIDPVIVQGNDETIYCIADMNPSGITTGDIMPAYGTGFVDVDGTWRLALTGTYTKPNENNLSSYGDPANYEYYVGDFDDEEFAHVLNMADGSETLWVVDEWYNIYKFNAETNSYKALVQSMVNDTTQIQQNAFYKDSELHVFNTGYLWLVTSTDNGRTWGNPTILNTQIKRSSDRALLASPGQGITASNGDIIIPFYDHGDGQENASVIWSSDNGKTWTRSNDVTGMWSSESEIVELYDGVLRMFYRNGTGKVCYADITKNNGVWTMGTGVQTNIAVTSTCNVTAITYSEKINGKMAVMVACPGGSGRTNGKLFTFLVDEDNSMELYSTYAINEGNYAYSCMTEMNNGSIGLLWENQAAAIRFDEIELDVVLGLKKNIVLDAGESYVEERAAETAGEITGASDETIATVTTEFIVEDANLSIYDHASNTASSLNSFSKTANVSLDLAKAEIVLTKTGENTYKAYNEAAGKYISKTGEAYVEYADSADSEDKQLKLTPTTAGDGSVTYRLCRASDSSRYTVFYFTNMDFNSMGKYNGTWADGSYELVLLEKQDTVSDTDVIPGYARATEIVSGNTYLITYIWTDGSVIVLYPGAASTGGQAKLVGDAVTIAKNVVTITGVNPGETSAVVDGISYHITVLDPTLSPSYAGNDLPTEGMKLTAGTLETSEGSLEALFDGNPSTFYHSNWSGTRPTNNDFWIVIELPEVTAVSGMRYLPRQNSVNGRILKYEISYSLDGKEWTVGTSGSWADDTEWKTAKFEEGVWAKYVKIFAVDSKADNSGRHMTAAELRVLKATDPVVPAPEVTPEVTPEPTPEIVPTKPVHEVFDDVKKDAWYAVGIQYVYDNGVMSGSNGLFNPTADITRAQLVTTLYRAAGEPEVTDRAALTDFSDLAEGKYYTDAVCWAYAEGVTTGTDGKFNPTDKLTRQQMAAFLFRFAEVMGMDTTARGDYSSMVNADKVSGYAQEPMAWAVGAGLISGSDITVNGVAAKDLNPRGNTTRAQVATILMRFCSY